MNVAKAMAATVTIETADLANKTVEMIELAYGTQPELRRRMRAVWGEAERVLGLGVGILSIGGAPGKASS
jgi:hypothetical protein